MPNLTTNFGLKKPLGNETADISVINENMDTIDAAIAARETPAGAQAKANTAEANAKSYADTGLSGKISHSLATAINDFLVASGPGQFVKKTLAEVKAILGLGSAAYKDVGVTGGVALYDDLDAHKSENASTTAKGHVQLATAEEAVAGIDTAKAVTPAGLKAALPVSLPANGGNADTVDSHHMNQDVLTTSSPTFANVYAPSFENFKQNGSLTNKVITPDTTQIAQTPIAPFLWHDLFAFNRVATPTFETSTDGSSWVVGALNSNLFSQKENQAVTVLNYATQKAVRWTWHASGFAWSSGAWLILGFTYVPTAANKTIKFESSADGTTWTARHISSGSWNEQPVWFYISSYGGDSYLRLTITWNSGNGNVSLSSIRLLTPRWGDQGQGSELSLPYDWDANRNIIAPNDVKAATFHKSDGTSVSYEGHTHTKSEITDMPTKLSQFTNDTNYVTQSELGEAGYGNMLKSVYDTNNDGIVDNSDKVDGIHGADLVKKDGSVAMDDLTIGTRNGDTGEYSLTQGNYCEASGNYSHAEGQHTIASDDSSHAEGASTKASGFASHAEGSYTVASGFFSHTGGKQTNANVYAAYVHGCYNKNLTGNSYSYSGTADAYVIGNGTSSAKSNAFRVTFDGKTYGLSAFNSSGADYAEYFEWADGNPNKEDRVGYFVTLEGEKIRKATSADDYILGIVSANPSVIGDSYQDDWNGKYMTDDWGRIQYHDVEVPAKLDESGNEIEPAHNDHVPILNPNWDNTQEYIPREKRPEWSTVGIMGKLLVRDDGTCQVNEYCKPNDEGIATASIAGYRVMKRVKDNIILIMLK